MDTISLILIIIGALNWGSIGIFGFDAIGAMFGGQLALIPRIIYTLVAWLGFGASSRCSATETPPNNGNKYPPVKRGVFHFRA